MISNGGADSQPKMAQKAGNDEIKLGRVVRVRVVKVTPGGVVVGFGRRLIGFIPVDEFSEGCENTAPAQLFRTGDNFLATIVTLCDGGKRVILSLKGTRKVESENQENATLAKAEETRPASAESTTFDRIYRQYQRESQMRLSLLRKNIESKRGEFR